MASPRRTGPHGYNCERVDSSDIGAVVPHRTDREPVPNGPQERRDIATYITLMFALAPAAAATAAILSSAVVLLGGRWWWPLVPGSAGAVWILAGMAQGADRYAGAWLQLVQGVVRGGEPTRLFLAFAAATWPWSVAAGALLSAALLRAWAGRPTAHAAGRARVTRFRAWTAVPPPMH